MKYPNVFTVESVVESATQAQAEINGNWVPARPTGFASVLARFRAAWLVFTGKADAVVWPCGQ